MDGLRSSSDHGDEETNTSSSPSFPFFNHNATTLPHNLQPNIDDKPTARQKRKRTSPEDQAVLEAYYACDPKPDKAARLDLVKRVALGEKEVQIWFQNRRQSSRRKSRPLLPHEIAQYQFSKSAVPPEDSSSGLHSNLSQDLHYSDDGFSATARSVAREGSSSPQDARPALPASSTPVASTGSATFGSSSQSTKRDAASEAPDFAVPSSGTDRESAQIIRDSQPGSSNFLTHGRHSGPKSPRRVRKVSSFVRLSMNSEGGAEVIAKDSSSPSPPRASVSSHPGHAGGAEPIPISLPNVVPDQESKASSGTTLRREPSGRSRDSRAWEFWCDKDCRSELEEKAEKDASGSASDAIQLLRSASGRNILGAIPTKRNSALTGYGNSAKRLRREGRMPLQRSSTFNGRPQGKQLGSAAPSDKTIPKLKSAKSAMSIHIPGNDSDKENWSPNSDLQSEEQLGAADGEVAGHASLDSRSRHSKGPFTFESRRARVSSGSIDPENDPEIAAFMRAGRESDKVSDHEELDCVQGLLSLSQGNWR